MDNAYIESYVVSLFSKKFYFPKKIVILLNIRDVRLFLDFFDW